MEPVRTGILSISENFLGPVNYNTRAIFFQGPIGRKIRNTVRIKRSFVQMSCAMSLVCPSIATHCTCQFLVRSEPINMPKTIESPAKCGVHAVIRFLYSEQVTRNVVFMTMLSRILQLQQRGFWSLLMRSVWSPTFTCPDLAPCDFHLFPRMKRS